AITGYLPLTGGTLSGPLVLGAGVPTVAAQAANKQYVDGFLPLTGGTLSGDLFTAGGLQAAGSVNGLNGSIGGVTLAGGSVDAPGSVTTGSLVAPNGINAGASTLSGVTLSAGNIDAAGSLTISSIAAPSGVNAGNSTIGGVTLSGGNVNAAGSLVIGTIAAPGGITTGSAVIGGVSFDGNDNLWPDADNASSCGTAGNAWEICAAYNFDQQSDPRGKFDIVPVPPVGPLAHVEAIGVHTYRFAGDPANAPLHWGMLSTEVRAEMGDNFAGWRQGTDPDQTESLGIYDLLGVLWAAVRELSARVTGLEGVAP
ncbi:MAG TPA: hypothetical protein VIY51_21390, partial [Xanthobacteraceae bacterium]